MTAPAVVHLPDPGFQRAQRPGPLCFAPSGRYLPMVAAEAMAKQLDASAVAEWTDLHDDIGDLLGGCSCDGFLHDLRQRWERDEATEVETAGRWDIMAPCRDDPGGYSGALEHRITTRQEVSAVEWLAGVERLTVAAGLVQRGVA